MEDRAVPLNLVPAGRSEEDLVATALGSRPEIKEAAAQVGANEAKASGATWGPFLPELSVEANAGALGRGPRSLDDARNVTASLGWKIGAGGFFDRARQFDAESGVRKAALGLALAKDKVEAEVRAAWLQHRSSILQEKQAREAHAAAKEAYELYLLRFEGGAGGITDVLLAQEALGRAELRLLRTTVSFNEAQLRLFIAVGSPIEKF